VTELQPPVAAHCPAHQGAHGAGSAASRTIKSL
jgi:hypothetical protein